MTSVPISDNIACDDVKVVQTVRSKVWGCIEIFPNTGTEYTITQQHLHLQMLLHPCKQNLSCIYF